MSSKIQTLVFNYTWAFHVCRCCLPLCFRMVAMAAHSYSPAVAFSIRSMEVRRKYMVELTTMILL